MTLRNRGAMGARLKAVSAGATQFNEVNTAVGYGSSSDPRVHFGLGKDTVVKELTVTFPSGAAVTLSDVAADRVLNVREPK